MPQERIQGRLDEEIIEVPAPQVMEEIVGVKHVPQERVQKNTVEQIVAVPVPHIREAKHRHSHLADSGESRWDDSAFSARTNLRTHRGYASFTDPGDTL